MRNPICLVRWVKRSLRAGLNVSGCDFVEKSGTPENVQVLECQTCGKISVGWTWPKRVTNGMDEAERLAEVTVREWQKNPTNQEVGRALEGLLDWLKSCRKG